VRLSRERLIAEASGLPFRPEIVEKVLHLLSLLEALRRHPALNGRIALKGGAAINLFLSDVPRLSLDIDLNYVGAPDLQGMLAERPSIEHAIASVSQSQDLLIERMPEGHAGGKWQLRYRSALGSYGRIAIDLGFTFRVPLWPTVNRDSRQLGSFGATAIPVLDIHEVAAGKVVALLSRGASRDLFDAQALLARSDLDDARLRPAFVAIGAVSRVDWRTVSPESVNCDERELRQQLLPLLPLGQLGSEQDSAAWARQLVVDCKRGLTRLLPLSGAEREFLERLLEHGEVRPELITADELLAARMAQHPALLWKAQSVRRHLRR
jgi:predicted nucleotidyltransferase component of viral defense system